MEREKKHLTEQEVEHFRRRAMAPAERRWLDAHVAACQDCLQRILDPAHSQLAFTALTEAFLPSADEEPFHLSHEELKRYVNEEAAEADQIIFESHLEICAQCHQEADHLQAALKSRPTAGRSGEWAESAPASQWGWLSTFRRWPQQLWTPPARAVAMIAIAGCVLLVLAFWVQKRSAERQEQAAQTEDRNNNQPVLPATPQSNSAGPAPTEEVAERTKDTSEEVDKDLSNSSSKEQGNANASPVAIRLKDGEREVGLDSEGKLVGLVEFSPPIQKAVQTALASEHLPEPQILNELTGPKISLMDQATDGLPFRLVAPVGTVISSNRPTLSWQSLNGATSYTVSVFDSNFNRVAKSSPQRATVWSVPLALQNGKLYSWQVTALKENQEITSPVAPAPRAQFKILEAEKLNEIASVRQSHPAAHLTLGVLYARAGLLEDAEREFQALVKDNPRSEVAKRLLHTVRAWRNR